MAKVIVIGALDTKGPEVEYVCARLNTFGVQTLVIDVGVLGEPGCEYDISRTEVALAGGKELNELISERHRGHAIEVMGRGASRIVTDLNLDGQVCGVFGLGGSAGTSVAAAAMANLPLGLPKLIVSTLASGNTRPYVGTKDIVMLNSVVDVAGINRISRKIFTNAAGVMAGMVQAQQIEESTDENLTKVIGVTMFGVTTPCVMKAMEFLEEHGYEVLVFHATGTGGQTLESLVSDGLVDGVLDITTTELADELVGGVLSAGPQRLEPVGKMGIVHLVVPGAIDMVNFGPIGTVPVQFRNRKLFEHNPQVTLMRTDIRENTQLGEIFAQKLNKAPQTTEVYIPLKGFSEIDRDGGPFGDADADQAFIYNLKKHLDSQIRLVEMDLHINDDEFALAVAQRMVELLAKREV